MGAGLHVASWLRDLGLERYEPVFRENEIDAEVLPQLTESDLAALGLPIGPRRKLLTAIAALREAGHTEAATPGIAALTATPGTPDLAGGRPGALLPGLDPGIAGEGRVGAAERRQLTVMFSDLVGSTA